MICWQFALVTFKYFVKYVNLLTFLLNLIQIINIITRFSSRHKYPNVHKCGVLVPHIHKFVILTCLLDFLGFLHLRLYRFIYPATLYVQDRSAVDTRSPDFGQGSFEDFEGCLIFWIKWRLAK
jgi:hypothetical protein